MPLLFTSQPQPTTQSARYAINSKLSQNQSNSGSKTGNLKSSNESSASQSTDYSPVIMRLNNQAASKSRQNPPTSRVSFVLPSSTCINNSKSGSSASQANVKTKRSGSITSLLPLKEPGSVQSTTTTTMNRSTAKPSATRPINPILKRRKSNSLSIIDYCNIINLNTNYQMLATFYDDTEESMARLSLKTNNHKDISKQASLSEQVAALFGSSMCTCYLCNLKNSSASSSFVASQSFNAPEPAPPPPPSLGPNLSTPSLRKVQQHNFEITPNKNNSDFSLMKYTYSTPFSQLSPLKLFNLINTDCSINFNLDQPGNKSNETLPNINSANNPTIPNLMQVNSNSPPIYDTRYLYLIDCRPNRKKFDKSRIHTAIHFSDILNDSVYLSPPIDNYTLIVLYDDDGTFLTSSSAPCPFGQNSTAFKLTRIDNSNGDLSSDEIISRIKAKINSSSAKTIYLLSGGFEQFQAKFPFMCSGLEIRSTTDRHKYLTIYPNCVIENQMYIGSGIQAKNWKIIRDLQITHIVNCSIEHECVFQEDVKYLHVKIEDSYQENIYRVINKALKFIEDAFEKYYHELAIYNDKKAALTPPNHHQGDDESAATNGSSRESSASTAFFYLGGSSNNQSAKKSHNLVKPKRPVFLIHCNLGISRSSSILIAYLINKYKMCLYAAFNYVKDKRLQIAPNYSFLRQLKQFEEEFY